MDFKNNLEGDLKMFTLRDGRDYLYTWDLNRQVIVEDLSITEVHFCNRTDDSALVVEVKDEDGLRVADIPNIILQQPWDIRVYAYCPGSYTKVEEVLKVKARCKPADYVYTETEIKNYEALEQQLNEVNERLTAIEGIGSCTSYYFDPEAIEWQTGPNPTYAPDDLVQFAQKVLAGEHVNLWIKDPSWQPAIFTIYENNIVRFQRGGAILPGSMTNIQPYQVYQRPDGTWGIQKLTTLRIYYADDVFVESAIVAGLNGYATEDYVNTAIQTALSGIAQAEGGAY